MEKISPDVGFAIPAAELSRILNGRLVSSSCAKPASVAGWLTWKLKPRSSTH